MGDARLSVGRIKLRNAASIEIERKHDPLQPSVDLVVNLLGPNANERSGKIGQEFFKL
jgi:hypothetical protein